MQKKACFNAIQALSGSAQEMQMIRNSKQAWEIGETVKVGFLQLRVLAKVATPGDFKPDAYVLTNAKADKFYRFVPHHGLEGGYPSMKAAIADSQWEAA